MFFFNFWKHASEILSLVVGSHGSCRLPIAETHSFVNLSLADWNLYFHCCVQNQEADTQFKPIPLLTMLYMYDGERQTSAKPALLYYQGWIASVKQVLTDPCKLDAGSNLQDHSKITTNPEWFSKACCSSAGASLSWHGECWYYAEVFYWFVLLSYRSDL